MFLYLHNVLPHTSLNLILSAYISIGCFSRRFSEKKPLPTFGGDCSAVRRATGAWRTSKYAEDSPLTLLLNIKPSQSLAWPTIFNFPAKRFGELGRNSKPNHLIRLYSVQTMSKQIHGLCSAVQCSEEQISNGYSFTISVVPDPGALIPVQNRSSL